MNIDAGTMRPTEHGIVCDDLEDKIRLMNSVRRGLCPQ
jgi:hypothetical protein